jgi:hypothetical protein
MLKFSSERSWYYTPSKTPVPREQDSVELDGTGFNWPPWAIRMVNDLAKNNDFELAIQTVSKLLKREREQLWQPQQLQ